MDISSVNESRINFSLFEIWWKLISNIPRYLSPQSKNFTMYLYTCYISASKLLITINNYYNRLESSSMIKV